MTERDVDYGVVAAVRILDTLRVTSPSIGGPVDLCRITPDKADALSEKDIDRVRKQVQRWSELEGKALDELFAG
jgi:proteasome beta subunit